MKRRKNKKLLVVAIIISAVLLVVAGSLTAYRFLFIPSDISDGFNTDNRFGVDKFDDYAALLFKKDGEIMPLRLKSPQNLEDGAVYPLVIYLHGDGGQGKDNFRQLNSALINGIANNTSDCYVLLPQAAPGSRWDDYGKIDYSYMLNACFNAIIEQYPIDLSRIYITGFSMGGWGVSHQIMLNYGRFAAAIIVSGGNDDTHLENWLDLPLWIAHGSNDKVVPTHYGKDLYNAITALGGSKAYYTEYSGNGHNIDSLFYSDAAVWNWLFEQQKPL
ncbi:MAG: dienelactone hydrolase family protein [Clostridiaceae bacterium]|jgi:predicted peptidase|nr:dienelactone hydrolase family protein [Clostridiaceae bacterium]